MTERTVSVRLQARTDQYKKAMTDAATSTEGLLKKATGLDDIGPKMDRLGEGMRRVGGTMTRSVTLPMVAALGLATKSASDLQQAVGGTEAVFGDLSDKIGEHADEAARASGLSERAFREATTSIGGQLKRMTGDVDMAAEHSIELTQVAADLAATYGGTTAEAVAALGSAFRGEADPAERFNLNLKIGAVNAKAVEMGLARTPDTVDDNARAQATLALITEQSADAQGQFARESGSAAGSMQIARAEMENASAEIGGALLPHVANLASGVADLATWFSNLPEPVQNATVMLGGMLAVTGPLLLMGGKLIENWQQLSKGAGYLADNIGNITKTAGALAVIGFAVERVIHAWSTQMDAASEDADALADSISRGMGVVDGALTEPVGSLDELHQRITELNSDIAELDRHHDEAINPFTRARYAETSDQLMVTRDALLAADAAAATLQADLGITADEAVRLATNQDAVADATDEATGEIDAQAVVAADDAEALKALEESIKGVTNALRAQFDPLFATQDALLANSEAQAKVKGAQLEALAAQKEYDWAVKHHGRNSLEAMEAARKLADAELDVRDANREAARTALDVSTATHDLKRRMEEGTVSFRDATAQLDLWVAQGLITEEQARQTKDELFLVAGAADNLGGRNIVIPVDADTSAFERKVAELYRPRGIRISVGGGGGIPIHAATGGLVPQYKAGGGVMQARGTDTVPAMLTPGEYVVRKSAVDALGVGVLDSLNRTSSTGAVGGGVQIDYERLASALRPNVSITNQYPAPERSSDSVVRTMRKAQLAMW